MVCEISTESTGLFSDPELEPDPVEPTSVTELKLLGDDGALIIVASVKF